MNPSETQQQTSLPAGLGYRMPAEWGPHQATWLSWPHNLETWDAEKLAAVERVLARAVRVLAPGEAVRINVLDADHEAHVRQVVGPVANVQYHRFPTNDAWCRDHGAVFIVRNDATHPLAAIDWGYNAWGGKYPPYDLDDAMPRRMAEALDVPRFEGGMILEGGSIEVNGAGLLLTTAECLLNPNRNPGCSRAEIEARLQAMLGVTDVRWLVGELAGDDTDGHIDNLTRFVRTDTVVTAVEDDPADENYAPLQENLARLRAIKGLRVETLPMPAPVYVSGRRMPAGYANFYIGNRAVLMPAYGDSNDAAARDILLSFFPNRRIVPLDCRHVIWGLGAFHCLTQQVPAV